MNWKSDRVTIRLFDPFAPNQTYVVSVGTDLKDLRNNSLDTAITLAFSTGATLDSGAVGGVVWRDGKAAGGIVMALYDLAGEADSLTYDSLYADYITTTNREGMFAFKYLPDRRFRLIAFEDKNRDQLFNPQIEAYGLPDREILAGGGLNLERLSLTVTTKDTLPPTILSTTVTPDNLIRTRLSKAVATSYLIANPSALTLAPVDDSAAPPLTSAGFLEADTSQTQVITAFFPNLISGLYGIELQYDPDKPILSRDSIAIERREDRTVPVIARFQPGSRSYYADQIDIQLTLSEPFDRSHLGPETFFLRENDSVLVPVTTEARGPFSEHLIPERLQPGKKYRLDIAQFDLVDLAGNQLGDSLVSYSFSTLNRDSLGSISGDVQIGLADRADAPVLMTFRRAGKADESYRLTVKGPNLSSGNAATPSNIARPFSIELPAGNYLLSGFVDEDGDGEPSYGRLYPFHHAETQAVYSDTVAVRARFETSGIQFKID